MSELVEHESLWHLAVGQTASASRVFINKDLEEYCDLTGDKNPIFRSDNEAREVNFERAIVPWPLLSGMFSDLLGTQLPGRGTGWLKQKNSFPNAAYPGETITAKVEIVRIRADKKIVNLKSTCTTQNGIVVCAGDTLVWVKNLENQSKHK